MDGPGIESRWGRDFPHLSIPALGPIQPSVQWVPGLSRGKERPGGDTDPSPSSSAVGHERVELYLYSPYGSYGLYRALVRVQGCTLPLPTIFWDVTTSLLLSVTEFSEKLTASISSVAFRTITKKLLRTQQINKLFFFDNLNGVSFYGTSPTISQ